MRAAMRCVGILALVLGAQACEDEPTEGFDAGDTQGSETGDTQGPETGDTEGSETSEGDSSPGPDSVDTADTSPSIDVPPDFTLTTGAVTPSEACAGAAIEVAFTMSAPLSDAATVTIELSGPAGNFANARAIGSGAFASSGSVSATLPGDAATGAGYRVRARLGDIVAPDNGADLSITAAPVLDVFFYDSLATAQTSQRVDNDSEGESFAWDFGADAVPPSSTEREPRWSYTSDGPKTVSLTATNAAGCSTTQVFADAIQVLGCGYTIPSSAAVYRDQANIFGGGGVDWICGGAEVSAGGGRRILVVEPGAVVNYSGGGTYAAFVKASGKLIGGDRLALVYETGAIIEGRRADAIACETLAFDTSSAPAGGCTTPGAAPVTVSLGAPGAGPHCPGADFALSFATDVAPAAGNRYLVQMSNAEGDFDGAVLVGGLDSVATSGTIQVDLPTPLVGGGDYMLRAIATNPSTISAAVGPLVVPTLVTADFSATPSLVFIGDSVAFADTTSGAHSNPRWDFGADATPPTSTAASPSVSWSTPGLKTVTLTVTDPSGCEVTQTKSVTVIGCHTVLPANTQLITGQNEQVFSDNAPRLVCGGASARVSASQQGREVFIAAGGRAEHSSTGGQNRYYVQDQALLEGLDFQGGGNVVVHGQGAILADLGAMQRKLCPDGVTFDTSALATQCPAFTPVPASLTVGAASLTSGCPGAQLSVPYTRHGLFPQSARFRLQLSDASGGFGSPTQLAEQRAANGDTFTVTLPTGAAAGTGYRLRVVSTMVETAAESPSTLTVLPRPTAGLSVSAQRVLEGTAVTITNTSTGATSYAWEFGADASPSTSTAANPGAVTWSDEGVKTVRLTVTNEHGCTHSVAPTPTTVYSCTPRIPSNAEVVTATASNSGGARNIWVCGGGHYTASGGGYSIFIEPGGTYDRNFGGGLYAVYAPAGSNYVAATGGGTILVRAPGANITGDSSNHTILECPGGVVFDRSVAPSPGCP